MKIIHESLNAITYFTIFILISFKSKGLIDHSFHYMKYHDLCN